jgi:LPS-assembly lipoprotein
VPTKLQGLAPLLALTLLLSGCGFHLRGQDALPDDIRQVYVRAPGALADQIEVHLSSNAVGRARVRSDADVVLTVHSERFDRRVLSVDPDTGKEQESELLYVTVFSATRDDGTVLLERGRLSLLRDYVLDPNAVIGKSHEEGVLRDELRRDAARQILRRLGSALRR